MVGIKAVGFDLDGTLYPGWLMYLFSSDLALRHPTLLSAYGKARRALHEEARLELATGHSAAEFKASADSAPSLRCRQAALVAASMGIGETEAARAVEQIIYAAMVERFRFIKPFPGVLGCLEALRNSGLRLGLLSDLPPPRKAALLGFEGRFETLLCSEDFGALKPSPKPFIALAEALETEPGSILYVGNKREFDIEGAKAAGMMAALLGRDAAPEADFIFRRWEELADWILERSGA
jgi:putative hydrolase of the HAD superfamily